MFRTTSYYLHRLGLTVKRSSFGFFIAYTHALAYDSNNVAVSEITANDLSDETVFGWISLSEARALIRSPGNRMFQIKEGNETIATCWVQLRDLDLDFIEASGAMQDGCAYVSHVIVKPQFRGKGLASRLLCGVAQHMGEEGVSTMVLCVDHQNASMLSVINHLGFMPYFSIRYQRILFIRKHFIQDGTGTEDGWQRMIDTLPEKYRVIRFSAGQSARRRY